MSLTNYTKQGTPFNNNLQIVPVDAVAADQSYFYATSHITMHPDTQDDGDSAWSNDSQAYCSGLIDPQGGYINPQAPPGQPMLGPDPAVFFREASAPERALRRFNREKALSRYLEKRTRRAGSQPMKKKRPGRQWKHQCRQVIASNRPRVRGRFVRTDAPVSYKEQQEMDEVYDQSPATSDSSPATTNRKSATTSAGVMGWQAAAEPQERQRQTDAQAQEQQPERSDQQAAQRFNSISGQDQRMSMW